MTRAVPIMMQAGEGVRRGSFLVMASYTDFTGSRVRGGNVTINGFAIDDAPGGGGGQPLGIECVASKVVVSFAHATGYSGPYTDWTLQLFKNNVNESSVLIPPNPSPSYSSYVTERVWNPQVVFSSSDRLHLEFRQLSGSMGLDFPFALMSLWFDII